jgi:hypothetical protein
MGTVLLKAAVIWLLLLALATVNAAIREKLLAPWIGPRFALPLSGLALALLIFFATLLVVPWLKARSAAQYWMVGALWLLMTILFELLLGRLVSGRPWAELWEAYNILTGNLWLVVLLVTAVAPYFAARIRRLI